MIPSVWVAIFKKDEDPEGLKAYVEVCSFSIYVILQKSETFCPKMMQKN
jgi:hypothetical protein